MRVSIERVTPEVATGLLQLNTANFRPIDKKLVRRYAEEMRRGEWQLNGDTIKVNGSVLKDGQHRLMAVVRSGVTVDMVICRDVEAGTLSMDRGKPRRVGHYLSYEGIRNANNIASMAKMCIAHNNGLWKNVSIQSDDVIDSEIVEFINRNDDRLQSALRVSNRQKIVPSTPLGSIFFLGSGDRRAEDCETACWFADKLSSGLELKETDAVLHLRNRFISQKKQVRFVQFVTRTLCLIAWNKTVRGEACSPSSLRIALTGPRVQIPPHLVEVAEV